MNWMAIENKRILSPTTQREIQMTALQKATGEVSLLIGFSQGPLHLPILNIAPPERTALAKSTAITQTRAANKRVTTRPMVVT